MTCERLQECSRFALNAVSHLNLNNMFTKVNGVLYNSKRGSSFFKVRRKKVYKPVHSFSMAYVSDGLIIWNVQDFMCKAFREFVVILDGLEYDLVCLMGSRLCTIKTDDADLFNLCNLLNEHLDNRFSTLNKAHLLTLASRKKIAC